MHDNHPEILVQHRIKSTSILKKLVDNPHLTYFLISINKYTRENDLTNVQYLIRNKK